MFTLLLVALSVGLDNYGAATAIGVAGVDRTLRVRIAVVFGTFEAAIPVLGIILGNSVAHELGGSAKPFGGALLGLVGAYAVVTDLAGTRESGTSATPSLRRLVLIGAALSVDNLVIGFALGASHTNLATAALTIGAVSVALSLLGLEIGSRLGGRLGERSELVGGAVLIGVGVAVGTGLL